MVGGRLLPPDDRCPKWLVAGLSWWWNPWQSGWFHSILIQKRIFIYIFKFLGVANHFLTWLANSANHIFQIIWCLVSLTCICLGFQIDHQRAWLVRSLTCFCPSRIVPGESPQGVVSMLRHIDLCCPRLKVDVAWGLEGTLDAADWFTPCWREHLNEAGTPVGHKEMARGVKVHAVWSPRVLTWHGEKRGNR